MSDSVTETSGGGPDLKKSRRKKAGFSDAAPRTDRLPPHSPEAEQGVLGCVLLSPKDCLGECVEKFKSGAEVFYDLRHQVIYETLIEMWDQRVPIDIITLQERLKNKQRLEEVGGLVYLASLPDTVPSAANLTYYVQIVFEKFVLRKMIHTCTDVVARVYDHEGEVDVLLDEVEKDILQIGQTRVETKSEKIKDLVKKAISTIEDYHARQGMLTGVGTGFSDLDKMTSGLHEGEMIVLAARPSMGKCLCEDSELVLEDGSIATMKEVCHRKQATLFTLQDDLKLAFTKPSAYVNDGIKPVFRVTTRLGRSIETTWTHPFLKVNGWTHLSDLKPGDRIAVPRKLEVFGNVSARECELKILAYLLGDGCLTHSSPTFTNTDVRLREDFAEAIASFGGVTVRSFDSRGTRAMSMRVVSDPAFLVEGRTEFGKRLATAIIANKRSARKIALAMSASPVSIHYWIKGASVPGETAFAKLCEVLEVIPDSLAPQGTGAISRNAPNPVSAWLKRLGLLGKKAGGKYLPGFIFTLPRQQTALFLNRLFATDGWASVSRTGCVQIGYASISERLCRQVQHLLLRFGIIAALRRKRVLYREAHRVSWQLEITDGKAIETFAAEIGIFGKEKQVRAVRKRMAANHYQTNCDLIPVGVWEILREARGKESWSALARRAGLRSHSNIHAGKRTVSRARLLALASALGNEILSNLATSDVYWDEIVAIEPMGNKQVYDLTIAGTHNFVANDICVHNTSLAMNIAEHVAIEEKLPVGVFSLEMTSESLVMRMLCSQARVNLRSVREGFLVERDFPQLLRAAGRLSSAPLFIDDSSGLSILQLRAKARRMMQQYSIKLFVIDYLQLLHSTARRAENRQQEIADISSGIKSLAKELKVPVIVLSQLNRELEKDKDRKPRLSDLRESGSIEQDADVVALLYKPSRGDDEDGGGEEQEALPVNLLIAKQRNGPTGDVHLTFLKSYTRFENAAKISDEDVRQ